MKKYNAMLLNVGVSVPFLYFGTILAGSLSYPGYSHLRQVVSALGAEGAPHPAIFNTGAIVTGVAVFVAAFGFMRTLLVLGGEPLLSWLASCVLSVTGLVLLAAGLFPLPDPRHGAFGLGVLLPLGPAMLALALRRRGEARRLRAYLLVTSLLMTLLLFPMTTGWGGLVTAENLGLFQRAFILLGFSWIGVAAVTLKRYAPRRMSPAASGWFSGRQSRII